MFDNATVLITGGTGSFGHAVMEKLLAHDVREVRIFSRDEKKQDDMPKALDDPKVKFSIGSVADYKGVSAVVRVRHGEKLYETLMRGEEIAVAENRGDLFRIRPDTRGLQLAERDELRGRSLFDSEGYHSHNTEQLSVEETTQLLMPLDFMKKAVPKHPAARPIG